MSSYQRTFANPVRNPAYDHSQNIDYSSHIDIAYRGLPMNESAFSSEHEQLTSKSNFSESAMTGLEWQPEYFSSLVRTAETEWLSLGAAGNFLFNGAEKAINVIYDAMGTVGPPNRPESGSLFIVDERRLPNWRDDGYRYANLVSESGGNFPKCGILYADGSLFGSRLRSGVAGSKTSLSRDTLSLTFIQKSNSDGSTPANVLLSRGAQVYSEQSLVLEWSVVSRDHWSSPPVNGISLNLQRRALRLPRIAGAGLSSYTTDYREGFASPAAGYIWIVQYLADKQPPRYLPEGTALQPSRLLQNQNVPTGPIASSPQKDFVRMVNSSPGLPNSSPDKPHYSNSTGDAVFSTRTSINPVSRNGPDLEQQKSPSTGGNSIEAEASEVQRKYIELSRRLDALDKSISASVENSFNNMSFGISKDVGDSDAYRGPDELNIPETGRPLGNNLEYSARNEVTSPIVAAANLAARTAEHIGKSTSLVKNDHISDLSTSGVSEIIMDNEIFAALDDFSTARAGKGDSERYTIDEQRIAMAKQLQVKQSLTSPSLNNQSHDDGINSIPDVPQVPSVTMPKIAGTKSNVSSTTKKRNTAAAALATASFKRALTELAADSDSGSDYEEVDNSTRKGIDRHALLSGEIVTKQSTKFEKNIMQVLRVTGESDMPTFNTYAAAAAAVRAQALKSKGQEEFPSPNGKLIEKAGSGNLVGSVVEDNSNVRIRAEMPNTSVQNTSVPGSGASDSKRILKSTASPSVHSPSESNTKNRFRRLSREEVEHHPDNLESEEEYYISASLPSSPKSESKLDNSMNLASMTKLVTGRSSFPAANSDLVVEDESDVQEASRDSDEGEEYNGYASRYRAKRDQHEDSDDSDNITNNLINKYTQVSSNYGMQTSSTKAGSQLFKSPKHIRETYLPASNSPKSKLTYEGQTDDEDGVNAQLSWESYTKGEDYRKDAYSSNLRGFDNADRSTYAGSNDIETDFLDVDNGNESDYDASYNMVHVNKNGGEGYLNIYKNSHPVPSFPEKEISPMKRSLEAVGSITSDLRASPVRVNAIVPPSRALSPPSVPTFSPPVRTPTALTTKDQSPIVESMLVEDRSHSASPTLNDHTSQHNMSQAPSINSSLIADSGTVIETPSLVSSVDGNALASFDSHGTVANVHEVSTIQATEYTSTITNAYSVSSHTEHPPSSNPVQVRFDAVSPPIRSVLKRTVLSDSVTLNSNNYNNISGRSDVPIDYSSYEIQYGQQGEYPSQQGLSYIPGQRYPSALGAAKPLQYPFQTSGPNTVDSYPSSVNHSFDSAYSSQQGGHHATNKNSDSNKRHSHSSKGSDSDHSHTRGRGGSRPRSASRTSRTSSRSRRSHRRRSSSRGRTSHSDRGHSSREHSHSRRSYASSDSSSSDSASSMSSEARRRERRRERRHRERRQRRREREKEREEIEAAERRAASLRHTQTNMLVLHSNPTVESEIQQLINAQARMNLLRQGGSQAGDKFADFHLHSNVSRSRGNSMDVGVPAGNLEMELEKERNDVLRSIGMAIGHPLNLSVPFTNLDPSLNAYPPVGNFSNANLNYTYGPPELYRGYTSADPPYFPQQHHSVQSNFSGSHSSLPPTIYNANPNFNANAAAPSIYAPNRVASEPTDAAKVSAFEAALAAAKAQAAQARSPQSNSAPPSGSASVNQSAPGTPVRSEMPPVGSSSSQSLSSSTHFVSYPETNRPESPMAAVPSHPPKAINWDDQPVGQRSKQVLSEYPDDYPPSKPPTSVADTNLPTSRGPKTSKLTKKASPSDPLIDASFVEADDGIEEQSTHPLKAPPLIKPRPQTKNMGSNIRFLNEDSEGVVTLTPPVKFSPFVPVAEGLRRGVLRLRLRLLMKLPRVRNLRAKVRDSARLIAEVKAEQAVKGETDDTFLAALLSQARSDAEELSALLGDEGGARGATELAMALRRKAEQYVARHSNGKDTVKIVGPLLGGDDEAEEAQAAARKGAARAAQRKARLKGGALGKSVMKKYSVTGSAPGSVTGSLDGEETGSIAEETGSVVSLDSEAPGPGGAPKPRGRELPSRFGKLNPNFGRSSSLSSMDSEAADAIQDDSVQKKGIRGALGRRVLSKGAEKDLESKPKEGIPSGRYRIVVEVLQARGLPAAVYMPGVLASGPGLVADPEATRGKDFTPDSHARSCIATVSLVRAPHVGADLAGRLIPAELAPPDSQDATVLADVLAAAKKIKVVGKPLSSEPSAKSSDPAFDRRFVLSMPLQAGLEEEDLATLAAAPAPEATEGDGVSAAAVAVPDVADWAIRVELVDTDRYVRDTFIGQVLVPLSAVPVVPLAAIANAGPLASPKSESFGFAEISAPLRQQSGGLAKGYLRLRLGLLRPNVTLRESLVKDLVKAKNDDSQGQSQPQTTAGRFSLGGNNNIIAAISGGVGRKSRQALDVGPATHSRSPSESLSPEPTGRPSLAQRAAQIAAKSAATVPVSSGSGGIPASRSQQRQRSSSIPRNSIIVTESTQNNAPSGGRVNTNNKGRPSIGSSRERPKIFNKPVDYSHVRSKVSAQSSYSAGVPPPSVPQGYSAGFSNNNGISGTRRQSYGANRLSIGNDITGYFANIEKDEIHSNPISSINTNSTGNTGGSRLLSSRNNAKYGFVNNGTADSDLAVPMPSGRNKNTSSSNYEHTLPVPDQDDSIDLNLLEKYLSHELSGGNKGNNEYAAHRNEEYAPSRSKNTTLSEKLKSVDHFNSNEDDILVQAAKLLRERDRLRAPESLNPLHNNMMSPNKRGNQKHKKLDPSGALEFTRGAVDDSMWITEQNISTNIPPSPPQNEFSRGRR